MEDMQKALRFAQLTASTLIVVLFAGNIYFIKRLVDKIDSTETAVWLMKEQIAVINSRLEMEGDHGSSRIREGGRASHQR